jgi:hypothetical protein
MVSQIETSSVIFRQDVYPRIRTSAETVQKYAEDLSVLPPIEVNQRNELIDGWHRWTAHKKMNAVLIPAIVTETASDAHLLELAIERNAAHGLQLSQEDKRDMARRIYAGTPLPEQGGKKEVLARIMSVSLRVVQQWLSRIDKDNKEKRDCACGRCGSLAIPKRRSPRPSGCLATRFTQFCWKSKVCVSQQTLATYTKSTIRTLASTRWKSRTAATRNTKPTSPCRSTTCGNNKLSPPVRSTSATATSAG